MPLVVVALVSLLAASCSHEATTVPTRAIDPAPPRAVDLNPDPDVVEINLEAGIGTTEYVAGHATPSWTYNGQVSGPLIEARVGNRVIVHFTNHLPEATTVHWHGIRVPAAMDGTIRMQEPVPPGGSFTYDFTVPEAGLFWYHPHMRSNEQVEKGLYGPFIVRGQDEVAAPERVLVLDDILLDDQGQPLPSGGHSQSMLGRDGNIALVNGKAGALWETRPGTWERWRVVNVSNARYQKVSLPGHTLVQIGTDGGLLERSHDADAVTLAPGERADLLIRYTGTAGTTVPLVSAAHTRGHGIQVAAMTLAQIRLVGEAVADMSPPLPVPMASITPISTDAAQTRRFVLEEVMDMGGGMGGMSGSAGVSFRINGKAYPNITPVRTHLGAVEVWDVVNDTEMDHPFHLHGFFFQPLTLNGVPVERQWKDTINIPERQTLRLAVRFDDHAGSFMFHCHILEHAELGMMGELLVESP